MTPPPSLDLWTCLEISGGAGNVNCADRRARRRARMARPIGRDAIPAGWQRCRRDSRAGSMVLEPALSFRVENSDWQPILERVDGFRRAQNERTCNGQEHDLSLVR
jgi:hypothetical protein